MVQYFPLAFGNKTFLFFFLLKSKTLPTSQKSPKTTPKLSSGSMTQMHSMETSSQTVNMEQSYKLRQRGCLVMENVVQDGLDVKLTLVYRTVKPWVACFFSAFLSKLYKQHWPPRLFLHEISN